MNSNIMKKQILNKMKFDIKGHCGSLIATFILSIVLVFTLIPFNLMTNLTYVLMDNLCPCSFFSFFFK